MFLQFLLAIYWSAITPSVETNRSTHYRDYLLREFNSRVRKNPAYSLRAFARDLGMQPSKLSESLRGLCGISGTMARKLASRLQLSSEEADYFVSLVELSHERSERGRKRAEERLKTIHASSGYDELSLERFKIISDWYHYAILELTELEHFESSPAWIAGNLGISTKLASAAIERLLDFGLLKRENSGKLIQTNLHMATPSGIPSRELREHHSQILSKADAALEQFDITERDFSAITLAIHSSQMEWARRELREFRRKFSKEIQEKPNKDRVYSLAIQFFPLNKQNKRGEKK